MLLGLRFFNPVKYRRTHVTWSIVTAKGFIARMDKYMNRSTTLKFPEDLTFFVADGGIDDDRHPVAFVGAKGEINNSPLAEMCCINSKAAKVLNVDPDIWKTFTYDTGFDLPCSDSHTYFF